MFCFRTTEKFSWLLSKNKVADEKSEHCNLTRKFVCLCKFSSTADCFKKAARWIFLLQKIRQMKAGQNNKYDITNAWGVVQVCLVGVEVDWRRKSLFRRILMHKLCCLDVRAFDAQRVAFNAVHYLHDIGVTWHVKLIQFKWHLQPVPEKLSKELGILM